jgi:hypothetical protein
MSTRRACLGGRVPRDLAASSTKHRASLVKVRRPPGRGPRGLKEAPRRVGTHRLLGALLLAHVVGRVAA